MLDELYDSSIIRPDPCLIRYYERIYRRLQELISHRFLELPRNGTFLSQLRRQLKTKKLRKMIRALRRIRIQRMGKLMEYYEKGLPVAQLIVQVLSIMSMKYKRLIESWQYTHNGYVCVTGLLPFLHYLAY